MNNTKEMIAENCLPCVARIISHQWVRYMTHWANGLLPIWQPETHFILHYTSLPFGIIITMCLHKTSTKLIRSILRLALVFINLILAFGLRSFTDLYYLANTGYYIVHIFVRLILTVIFALISMHILPYNRDDEGPSTRI